MKNSDTLLLIFTRNPELGKVKSRLAADVGEQSALEIYKFLLKHTHKITAPLLVDKQVWYSNTVPTNDLWSKGNFTKKQQIGTDLGERMQWAFQEGFKNNYKHIAIIGSDLYDLSQDDLEQALRALKKNEVVIGPATDGGFYFLGLSVRDYAVFKDKDWGTSSVFKNCWENLKNYKSLQLSSKNDVDYLADIADIDAFQPFLKKTHD